MSPEQIDAILLAVYRRRLNETNYAGPDILPADRQVRDDKDGGQKQKRRAESFRPVVMATLIEAGLAREAPHPMSKEARAARTLSEGE